MDLSENRSNNPNIIIQAQADQCEVAGQTYQQSIIIPSDDAIKLSDITGVNELSESLVTQLCDYEPEVIIMATGASIEFPDTATLSKLVAKNIGLEVLSNQAAARTFNVLLAERRKAVCLMIINTEE